MPKLFNLADYPGARSDLDCPECGERMALKPSKYGAFYGCSQWSVTGCKGSHGAHPDGAPMGTPANEATKRARVAAHDAFDAWWKKRGMKRRDAYSVMRRSLGVPEGEAHISMFDIDLCERLVALVEESQ